jgi:hypothetical protein
MPRYPSNKSPNLTQDIENKHNQVYMTHVIPYKRCANVVVAIQIETSEFSNAKSK